MSIWKVVPGTTSRFVYRWGAVPLIYVPVTVSNLTPLRFTATSHGIPDGWSVAVADFPAYPQLQAQNWPPKECDYSPVKVPDANTIEFNLIDANRCGVALSATGTVAYQTPTNLSSMSGSFVIDTTTPLIISPAFDNTAKTITVTVTNVQSGAWAIGSIFDFTLKVTDSGGAVTQLDFGTIEVVDGTSC